MSAAPTPSMVPDVLKEEITEREKAELDAVLVTDYEKRQKLMNLQRAERMKAAAEAAKDAAVASASAPGEVASAPAAGPGSAGAAPIGSSEAVPGGPKPVDPITQKLMDLVPGIRPQSGEDAGAGPRAPGAVGADMADIPEILEDIRESLARIQDRSYMIDPKNEYPARAPAVAVDAAPGELCSRRYGFCRTIPMILRDISFHMQVISTVPSRQQLIKDLEQPQTGVSPFHKAGPPAAPAAPAAPGMRPPAPYGQGDRGGPYPYAGRGAPYAGRGGPFPPRERGFDRERERAPGFPPPEGTPLPKPSSAAPPTFADENDNEDVGDGLDDAPGPRAAGGAGGDMVDIELDEDVYGGAGDDLEFERDAYGSAGDAADASFDGDVMVVRISPG